jgi:hypothetical protein
MLGSFCTSPVVWDIFPDSSAKDPESVNEIPKGEDNPSSSGTKSSHHLSKDLNPKNASPETTIVGPCDTQKLWSSESAESPKTTPPNNPCHRIGSANEDPIGGDSAQPQPESLPW